MHLQDEDVKSHEARHATRATPSPSLGCHWSLGSARELCHSNPLEHNDSDTQGMGDGMAGSIAFVR